MAAGKKIGKVKVPAGHLAYVNGAGDVIAKPFKRAKRKAAKRKARKGKNKR